MKLKIKQVSFVYLKFLSTILIHNDILCLYLTFSHHVRHHVHKRSGNFLPGVKCIYLNNSNY